MRLPRQLAPVSHTPTDYPTVGPDPRAAVYPAFAPDYTIVHPNPIDRPLPMPIPFPPGGLRPVCMRCFIFCPTLLRCQRICIRLPC